MARTVLLVVGFIAAAVVALSPEQKLQKCCASARGHADDGCLDEWCSADAISQATVLSFLDDCGRKGQTLGLMWDCASMRFDHSACCEDAGVSKDCMPYCRADNGVPTEYEKYTFCVEEFDKITGCFQEHMRSAPVFTHRFRTPGK